MDFSENIHIFCRVIDNFGDVGVCWRLSRQLANEHAIEVTLWIDDLAAFHKICAEIEPHRDRQQVQGVEIRHWRGGLEATTVGDVAGVVIEAFGCELPPAYIAAMAICNRKPVWINLEYLSAESWVNGCHTMQSLYPALPLIKYFFFPGFTGMTGGLLLERDVIARRDAFQSDAQAVAGFLESIGVHAAENACKISLFCYPTAPVKALFDALQVDTHSTVCLVPQGVASDAVGAFLQRPAIAGASAARGGLTVQVLPFLDQPDYDKLLWACDMNFVRGEDSLVRAQWAARPFVWHIYPQQNDAHRLKLDAFIDRYTAEMPAESAHIVTDTWQTWNGAADIGPHWRRFRSAMPQLTRHMVQWTRQLRQNGDLASNLIRFIREIG